MFAPSVFSLRKHNPKDSTRESLSVDTSLSSGHPLPAQYPELSSSSAPTPTLGGV
ncbi:hypothetical protein FA13DRAFT_1725434 [Coprinellus micaceus]|uniref:Uncharacterized protein n=1 Tax=Coprinellus micaceus TaxID=71717 RepID=A0A4Y7TV25_COPMI|nr:hypothetical protein FA13DRAFT_1725434 [Coprinellus micaceus]